MSVALTRGVLFVHSAPTALCPHVEWAIGSVVETDRLEWTLACRPGMFRAELLGQEPRHGGSIGFRSARLGAPALRGHRGRQPGIDGGRWLHTPDLGIFLAVTDVHGNIVVPEDRIRYA